MYLFITLTTVTPVHSKQGIHIKVDNAHQETASLKSF